MNSRVVFADAKYGAKLATGKRPISFDDPALHVQNENQIKRGQLIKAGFAWRNCSTQFGPELVTLMAWRG
ncbi:hypothetical protein P6U16_25970 (plasmid) [Rhizobium sp. 32-5/1]|uniref:hypothetical protein n=1 Tax=Rhizobium sp. 32-5/1 TaxID=3019602 RepID=UPI00240DED05|nr:hypothetical protein [Rhizobium sp. 32-5/1]WEZ85517.1 hypothetical protein P6U16_25970 [Rhizobium sp. 32-5/1]